MVYFFILLSSISNGGGILSQSPLTDLLCDFINLIYSKSQEKGNKNYVYLKDREKYDKYEYRFNIKNEKGDYNLDIDATGIDTKFILDNFNRCSREKYETIEDIIGKIKLKDTEKNKGLDKFKSDIKHTIEYNWVNISIVASCYYYVKNHVLKSSKEIGYANDAYDIIYCRVKDLEEVFGNLNLILDTHNDIKNGEYINLRILAKKYFQFLLKYSNDLKERKKDIEIAKYTFEDAAREVFISNDDLRKVIELLEYKKNIIIQGQPGVGKTFIAERIAYCISGKKDKSKVKTVQFHQAYAYDDFIQGYKPSGTGLIDSQGTFFSLCEEAKMDNKQNKYFLIIDEINRGNINKIFGDTMSLIEADMRGEEHSISLTYSKNGEKFYVPENVYIIGTMNTADRSIVEFDYAFRRRFSFYDLKPIYGEKFKEYLKDKGISAKLANKIAAAVTSLNEKLVKENQQYINEALQVGHSYFTPTGVVENENEWYRNVVNYEIRTLLDVYYKFSDRNKIDDRIKELLSVIE